VLLLLLPERQQLLLVHQPLLPEHQLLLLVLLLPLHAHLLLTIPEAAGPAIPDTSTGLQLDSHQLQVVINVHASPLPGLSLQRHLPLPLHLLATTLEDAGRAILDISTGSLLDMPLHQVVTTVLVYQRPLLHAGRVLPDGNTGSPSDGQLQAMVTDVSVCNLIHVDVYHVQLVGNIGMKWD